MSQMDLAGASEATDFVKMVVTVGIDGMISKPVYVGDEVSFYTHIASWTDITVRSY